jgi:hypothetical protein
LKGEEMGINMKMEISGSCRDWYITIRLN